MQEVLMAIAMIITGARSELPPAEIEARFEQACVDGRWEEDCPGLRTEIEVALYGELRELGTRRAPIDREILRTAVRSSFPPLVDLGLRRLEKIDGPEDREAVVIAVEHPSPAIRALAKRYLDQRSDPSSPGLARWWLAAGRSGWDGLVPDPRPELRQLGIASAEGMRFRYFASGEHRAVFTSKLAPEVLLQQIAKGRKVYTGADLAAAPKQQQAFTTSMEDVQKQMQAAMARGDFKALAEISERIGKQTEVFTKSTELLSMQPVKEFAGDPAAIRYVQIPASKSAAPITIAVARDEGLGETVMVISY